MGCSPTPNLYTSATSTSGSSPSVAENRTFAALSVRTVQGDVRATHGLYEISQLYAASPDLAAVAACGLMGSDGPERRLFRKLRGERWSGMRQVGRDGKAASLLFEPRPRTSTAFLRRSSEQALMDP